MKLYKFEIEEKIDRKKFKMAGYGSTPEEAIEAQEELVDVYSGFYDDEEPEDPCSVPGCGKNIMNSNPGQDSSPSRVAVPIQAEGDKP